MVDRTRTHGYLGGLPADAPSKADVLLFIIFPFFLGGLAAWLGFDLKTDVLNGLLTAFSIFAGLLLNLLVLVFSFTQANAQQQSGPTEAYVSIRRRVLRQIHANISFSIVVSLAVVVTTIVALWTLKHSEGAQPGSTGWVLTFLITLLTCNFVLTLMMVLKRMYILISDEFERARRAA